MLPFDQCQNTRRNFKCINITPNYIAMQAIVLSTAVYLPDMMISANIMLCQFISKMLTG